MYPLQVIMIISSTAMLFITALLLIVRKMPSRPGIEWWIFSSLTQAIIYVTAYITYPTQIDGIGMIVFFSLQTLVCQGLNIGTLSFINRKINVWPRMAAATLSIVGIFSLVLSGKIFFASCLFAGYMSIVLLEVAYYIYKLEFKSLGCKFAGVFFVLNALHWLDYPFLSRIEWFAPIGFMIGMMLVVGIFLSLAFLSLMQFKQNTEESEKLAIEASIHDPLTGLYNRLYLDQLFTDYAVEAEEIQRPFILLYFDLDGFKYINDTYGHAAGDLILTTVTRRMTKWLGSKGDAVRVGGDELVVLTRLRADFSKANALNAAQRILNLIEQPIVDGANIYNVSASIGGCCYGMPDTELDIMIKDADSLMYKAKKDGGHRIYFSEFLGNDQESDTKSESNVD